MGSVGTPPRDIEGRTAQRIELVLHLMVLLSVCLCFESLFVGRGLNMIDEGWPLYAARELLSGRTLYEEIFWVFPPGHLLPALIGHALDPPGIIAARLVYSGFTVAACVGLYALARRLMPAHFALLAGLMVAVAAPRSHWFHLLFGYRYLVFSVITLLCFERRLATGDARWLLPAGFFAATSFCFRVTPAIAVTAAVGVATLAASRAWRRWLVDGAWYAAGFAIVAVPVLGYVGVTVGFEKLWLETVLRPMEMTALQSQPMPVLAFWGWGRMEITATFVAFSFRFYLALYAAMTAALLIRWLRSFRHGGVCESPLLLAVVLWGGIYFARVLGRSDEAHLDSAVPPAIVVLVYLISFTDRIPWLKNTGGRARVTAAGFSIGLVVLTAWIYLLGSDRFLDPMEVMGDTPLESVEGITVHEFASVRLIDSKLPLIRQLSEPDLPILVMMHLPLLYVLAERHGPGYHDVIMPGTFLSGAEEQRFLERLKASPPAVVIWPTRHFDGDPRRGLPVTAPLLVRWIIDNYRRVGDRIEYSILIRPPQDPPPQ